MNRFACLVICLSCWAAPALAVELDPDKLIRPEILGRALEAMAAEGPEADDTGRLVVVDYGLRSSSERAFVIDLATGAVTAFRAAHGLGSDKDHDGFLDIFSDKPGSSASPEGTYRIAESYWGKHGRSLRLDGLSETNAKARDRAIVIHAADYAEPAFLTRHGKLGRSNGCIVFSEGDLASFRKVAPEGTLIFVGK